MFSQVTLITARMELIFTYVGLRNQVLDGVPDLPWEREIWGIFGPLNKKA